MTDNNETVKVPVALLTRLVMIARDSGADDEAVEANELLPKPKPRLVVVDLDAHHPAPLYLDELQGKPDLLTLLETAVGGYFGAAQNSTAQVMVRIRAALGVDQ